MNGKTNVFETRTYEVKDFGSKEAMEKHLEFKIGAVTKEHTPTWNVTKTERLITDTTAKAKIHMVRN